MRDYEKFQLQWMIDHGYSLSDLMRELQALQYDDPEDSDRISTPITELFEEWEQDVGFGSEIWPCEAEWEECEAKEAGEGKLVLFVSGEHDSLDAILLRALNYDGERFAQSFADAEMKWMNSDGEYFDTVVSSLREDGYEIEELNDYAVFEMRA